jgi:thiamine-monophosphate kinase
MMDLSDGLSLDAHRMARASGVHIVFDSAALPLSPALRRAGETLGVDPLNWVLSGGEDYELLFTAAPSFDPSAVRVPQPVRLTCIGRVANRGAGVMLRQDGREHSLEPAGWDHIG